MAETDWQIALKSACCKNLKSLKQNPQGHRQQSTTLGHQAAPAKKQ